MEKTYEMKRTSVVASSPFREEKQEPDYMLGKRCLNNLGLQAPLAGLNYPS